METHLVKKEARLPSICTSCDNEIKSGEAYHTEKGTNQHLHSLLARHFCSNCYAKYGEISLLSKKK